MRRTMGTIGAALLLLACGSAPAPSDTPDGALADASTVSDADDTSSPVPDAEPDDAASPDSATVDAAEPVEIDASEPRCPADPPPSVGVYYRLEQGLLQGERVADSVLQFLGVPFAAPPTGDGRWRAPESPSCFEAAGFAAINWPPLCPQLDDAREPVGDEDCLQLNIWAPEGAQNAPVMFFLPGGGNVQGGAAAQATPGTYLYDGALWARELGAVVVVANYRLGVLGFLHATEEEGADEPVAGNFGIQDQLAALRWVNENIGVLGGDPERVVLFGESAGAANTCRLLASPAAAGLFDAAIMQSGGPCSTMAEEEVLQQGAEFLLSVDDLCGGSIACLREQDASVLVERADAEVSVSARTSAFQPWVDGELLPDQPARLLLQGVRSADRIIVGANADETSRSVPESLTEAQFNALLTTTFNRIAPQVRARYPLEDFDSPWAAWVAITGDYRFVCAAETAAEVFAEGGGDAYLYHFGATTSGSTARYGAWHGLELVHLFGGFAIPGYVASDDEIELGRSMRELWTALGALEAVPGADLDAQGTPWPAFSPTDREALILDLQERRTSGDVRRQYCDFWTPLIRRVVAE